MSKFYKVDIQGKNWLQRVNGLPAWTPNDEGRIVYDLLDSTAQLYIGGPTDWISAGQYGDVPLGTKLLMESDVATIGYSLLTDKDDMVMYITKGSAAGGEAGGTDKTGGTWTQPNHTHTVASGTVPGTRAHTHPGASGLNFSMRPGAVIVGSGDSQTVSSVTGSNSGTSTSHDHGGATGNGATANTWRPSGRNFTRQERV